MDPSDALKNDEVIAWLLDGDVAVQFQTYRDLLDDERLGLQAGIASQGDAAAILAAQTGGRWGRAFYQPKWTSTHYSLLELRDLGVSPEHPVCRKAVAAALEDHKCDDGGINPTTSVKVSDVCMNGMFLSFACHFGAEQASLESVVDFVLGQTMPDGGFNCQSNRSGARVASVHTTTSVIEGFTEYLDRRYAYRAGDVRKAVDSASEVLLDRRLYQRRSDGQPIRAEFTRLHHPARWHFDVLRGLDVLRGAGEANDPRLADALGVIRGRCRADGRWAGAAQYPGETHVSYPRPGTPNRWVTLRALRTIRHFSG